MMTGRERIETLISGGEPDRIIYSPNMWQLKSFIVRYMIILNDYINFDEEMTEINIFLF